MNWRCLFTGLAAVLLLTALAPSSVWAQPSVDEALKLKPVQLDIDYETPTEKADITASTIEGAKIDGHTAWVVRGPNSQLLRRFIDTNDDNRVDQWCYFQNGIEVYRDLDTDFNGKADEYRWMGTAGTRWGIDKNEDRKVDDWKLISAEEVSSEYVAAVRDKDESRFAALLLRPEEAEKLGLEQALRQQVLDGIGSAKEAFDKFARAQKQLTAKSNWVDFGGQRPALLPAGIGTGAQDLIFYDAVIAMVETDGDHKQLPVGTLLLVDGRWRLLANALSDQPAEGLFSQVSTGNRSDSGAPAESINADVQKLVTRLEELDKQQEKANPNELTQLNLDRADVLEQLAATVPPADQGIWYRQLADLICSSTQSGQFNSGTERLQKLVDKLTADSAPADLMAHVRYCQLQADYATKIQDPKADFPKVQEEWEKLLTEYVSAYPQATQAAEAMIQLAVASEFAGQDEKAIEWYRKVASDFAGSTSAPQATGALRRLESVGKPLELAGPTLDGRGLDVAKLKGKTVLVHYWATWWPQCTKELDTIAELAAKYSRKGFVPVGVNVDNARGEAQAFVKAQKIAWPQLYQDGGLDKSPLATQLGVYTVPMMVLIGPDGTVISRSLTIGELAGELEKIYR